MGQDWFCCERKNSGKSEAALKMLLILKRARDSQ